MGKFVSRHKFCIIKTLEQYIFPFLGDMPRVLYG